MNEAPTFNELLECINAGEEQGRANCSVGFFVTEYENGAEDPAQATRDVDSVIARKPVVAISSFIEDNQIFYDVRFRFRSYNDADYKQMWRLICKFADKARHEVARMDAGDVLDKITALAISVLPDKYRGKYFVFINMPFPELISRSENAFDGTAEISLICDDNSFGALIADDDAIDQRYIEAEIEQEIMAEQGV